MEQKWYFPVQALKTTLVKYCRSILEESFNWLLKRFKSDDGVGKRKMALTWTTNKIIWWTLSRNWGRIYFAQVGMNIFKELNTLFFLWFAVNSIYYIYTLRISMIGTQGIVVTWSATRITQMVEWVDIDKSWMSTESQRQYTFQAGVPALSRLRNYRVFQNKWI